MTAQPAHRNNFDFFRLSAAILVWYGHCYALSGHGTDPMPHFISFESSGSLGVTIFFIISGYFVTMSYDNNNHFITFMKNRALRILPALCAVVLLCVFALGPVVTSLSLPHYFENSATWHYLNSLLVFPVQYKLPGVFGNNPVDDVNGSLWTLRYELRLYLAVAALGVLGILQPRLVFVLLLGLCSIRLYGEIFTPGATEKFFYTSWGRAELTVRLSSQFAVGAFLYLAREKLPLKTVYFAIAVIAIMAGIYMPFHGIGHILFDLSLGYLVICVGFMKLPLLHYASKWGDFSYGFYLYAFPMQQLSLHLLGTNASFTAFMFTSFSATFLCAVLSWHCIEKPALALKR